MSKKNGRINWKKAILIGVIIWLAVYAHFLLKERDLPFDPEKLLFTVAGGLALFLYGMEILSVGLRNLAGNRLKSLLKRFTKTTFTGILFGLGATAILQSSSATTVMVVGLINTGLLSLKGSIGVIMGSNIGTTVTGQIMAFNFDAWALPIMATGIFLSLFSEREKTRHWGQTLAGFGLLFFGLNLMKSEIQIVAQSGEMRSWFLGMANHPFLALIGSTLFTVVIQSSSAAIGVVIALAAAGALDFPAALPLILGLNIGTTVTANLAALKASANAKRAALIHFVFKLAGTVLFFFFLTPFGKLTAIISGGDANPERLIANAHTLFNLISSIVFFPFVQVFVKIAYRLIPKTADEDELLDEGTLSNPDVALDQVKKVCLAMRNIASNGVKELKSLLLHTNKIEERGKIILTAEEKLDRYHDETLSFLQKLGKSNLNQKQAHRLTALLHIANHFEQIGDLLETIKDAPEKMATKRLEFNAKQKADWRRVFQVLENMLITVEENLQSEGGNGDGGNNGGEKIQRQFAEWKIVKEDVLSSNRQPKNWSSRDLDRMNYLVDIMLPLNEIAKKCTNIAWETGEGDRHSPAAEENH